jgi:hypothetical protein
LETNDEYCSHLANLHDSNSSHFCTIIYLVRGQMFRDGSGPERGSEGARLFALYCPMFTSFMIGLGIVPFVGRLGALGLWALVKSQGEPIGHPIDRKGRA